MDKNLARMGGKAIFGEQKRKYPPRIRGWGSFAFYGDSEDRSERKKMTGRDH